MGVPICAVVKTGVNCPDWRMVINPLLRIHIPIITRCIYVGFVVGTIQQSPVFFYPIIIRISAMVHPSHGNPKILGVCPKTNGRPW